LQQHQPLQQTLPQPTSQLHHLKTLDIKSGFRLNEITRNAAAKEEQTEVKEEAAQAFENKAVTEADVFNVVKRYAELKNQNKQFQAATMLSGQLVKYNEPVITILIKQRSATTYLQ
jgi:hypothetical protein